MGSSKIILPKVLCHLMPPIFSYNLDLVSVFFVCSLVSVDCAKLQLKEGLKHVSCTRTSTGSVTKLAAATVFQVLYL